MPLGDLGREGAGEADEPREEGEGKSLVGERECHCKWGGLGVLEAGCSRGGISYSPLCTLQVQSVLVGMSMHGIPEAREGTPIKSTLVVLILANVFEKPYFNSSTK